MAERRRPALLSDQEVSPESLRTHKAKMRAVQASDKGFFNTHLKRKLLLGFLLLSLSLFCCCCLAVFSGRLNYSDFVLKSDEVKADTRSSNTDHSQPLNYRTATGGGKFHGVRDIDDQINIFLTFTNIEQNTRLKDKLEICVTSILRYSTSNLVIFIIGDSYSHQVAAEILSKASLAVHPRSNYQLISVDIESLSRQLHGTLKDIRSHFSSKPGDYYGADLFFVSMALHQVLPSLLHKVIMMDIDVKLQADVGQLFAHFDRFNKDNVIGIAHEMQPVYRHILYNYRKENPQTRAGGAPTDGFPGFNSGVLLLDLDRLRKSSLYNSLLRPQVIANLTHKYRFKGHLGDQDFYTLVALEYPQLFYVLPCSWNRQLCQWWKDKGYERVFDDYYRCEGQISLYHGNCDTPFPE
ncbi:xyloside xylosyltransferase 1-like [Argonauta hians]